LQKAYSYKGYKKGDFPVTEKVAEHQLSLPFWPEIANENILKVAELLSNYAISQ